MGSLYEIGRHNCYLWWVASYLEKLWTSCSDDAAAAVGGTYEFIRFASANLREKDDSMNTALGGFLAGSILGLRREWLC